MESPSKGQAVLLLEQPLFILGGHLYQYQNLLCQMQLIGYRVFLGIAEMLPWLWFGLLSKRIDKPKVFVEVVPSFQSTEGCLVAAPDSYKAVLEAFIGPPPPHSDLRYTLGISQCHLDICNLCETRRMRSHLCYTCQQQWKGCLDHILKVFCCRGNFGAIRLKLKMPEQVNSVRNFTKKTTFHGQRISFTMELRMPRLGFSVSNVSRL